MSQKQLVLPSLMACAGILLASCGNATPATVEVTRLAEKTIVVIVTPTPNTSAPTPLPAGSVQITAAGATFPLPVYTEWAYAFQYVDPSVVINYQGIGSGGGKKGIIDGTLDFAGSDSVLKDEEYTSGKDLQMYPILAGAVVPIYNITGLAATDPALVLDRNALAAIFTGSIIKWNDPAIVALNKDLAAKLPASQITVVHRSDGSGTTEIFTNALAAFSEEFKTKVGAGSAVEWPVDKAGNGIGGKGNAGVAAAVQTTPNSIGYVELSYALSNKIPFTSLVNKAGKIVAANQASLASAMNDFAGAFSDKLTANIVDGGSEASWPIAGYTYIILHTTGMTDCVKAQKILEYMRWSLTDASAGRRAGELGYSVLPAAVRDTVLAKLGEVTCKGNKVLAK
jgi:phosphate transport system substrate-binding protein